jgi:plastocyanin
MSPSKVLLLALLQATAALVEAISIPVQVGAGGELIFTADTDRANLGDTIDFMFLSHNHTVTQGDPTQCCTPLSMDASREVDSGYVYMTDRTSNVTFTAADTNIVKTLSVKVQSTEPMLFYCAQATHCQEGMVFAINAKVYPLSSKAKSRC